MRLIDADEFIANLKDYTDKPMTAGLCATLVELAPTAYDIGKVIEELKATKGYACYGMKCDECKYTHDCFEGEKSQEMAIDKAIEIVKQGGVIDG